MLTHIATHDNNVHSREHPMFNRLWHTTNRDQPAGFWQEVWSDRSLVGRTPMSATKEPPAAQGKHSGGRDRSRGVPIEKLGWTHEMVLRAMDAKLRNLEAGDSFGTWWPGATGVSSLACQPVDHRMGSDPNHDTPFSLAAARIDSERASSPRDAPVVLDRRTGSVDPFEPIEILWASSRGRAPLSHSSALTIKTG